MADEEDSFVKNFSQVSAEKICIKLLSLIDDVYDTIKRLHLNDPSLEKSKLCTGGTAAKDALIFTVKNPFKIKELVQQIVNMVKLGLTEAKAATQEQPVGLNVWALKCFVVLW